MQLYAPMSEGTRTEVVSRRLSFDTGDGYLKGLTPCTQCDVPQYPIPGKAIKKSWAFKQPLHIIWMPLPNMPMPPPNRPKVLGIHHLKFAVSNLSLSLAWYERVMGAHRISSLDHVDGAGDRFAVVCEMRDWNGLFLELRENAVKALDDRNWDTITLAVGSRQDLSVWLKWLDMCGTKHSAVLTGLRGWVVVFEDPDGRCIQEKNMAVERSHRTIKHGLKTVEMILVTMLVTFNTEDSIGGCADHTTRGLRGICPSFLLVKREHSHSGFQCSDYTSALHVTTVVAYHFGNPLTLIQVPSSTQKENALPSRRTSVQKAKESGRCWESNPGLPRLVVTEWKTWWCIMSESTQESTIHLPGHEAGSTEAIWEHLRQTLDPDQHDSSKVVLMLCGVAGAGKSTLSYKITQELPSFARISIDGIIAERYGVYGVNYPAQKYQEYQEEADAVYLEEYKRLLATGKANIILDRSFYAKEDRDLFRHLAEAHGARVVLVYLDVDREILWQRICDRQARTRTADNALDIDRALLDQFCDGFEVPNDEGAVAFRCKLEDSA
ncbi:hypothetical protein Q7P37_008971 [Cladosporium fusiforme]